MLVSLVVAPAAQAKLMLQFDRGSARAGERVYIRFGAYFEGDDEIVHVYLVRAALLGRVIYPDYGGGWRLGPAPKRAGVREVGRTRSGEAGLAFRLPAVRTGRYAAVIWCSTCENRQLLAGFPQSVPDDAYVRPDRRLLRVVG